MPQGPGPRLSTTFDPRDRAGSEVVDKLIGTCDDGSDRSCKAEDRLIDVVNRLAEV